MPIDEQEWILLLGSFPPKTPQSFSSERCIEKSLSPVGAKELTRHPFRASNVVGVIANQSSVGHQFKAV
jgi:hypothetical protein